MVLLLTSFMKIDVVLLFNCYIALLFVTLHSATATVLLKLQRRKCRPFGTPPVAKDCVFIIVFWLFLGINLKPQTLNFKLSKLPLTFAYCLLFISHFSSLTAPCLPLMLFSRKDAESQRVVPSGLHL